MSERWNASAQAGLLDLLAQRAGCTFVSDLHQLRWQYVLMHVLLEIVPEQYSLQEWNDSIQYILEHPAAYRTQQQACEGLRAGIRARFSAD